MSTPTTHDPRFVNTRDGVCWERRAVTDSGLGLYAVEGSCKCPEFKMATFVELAAHGIVEWADALPMPVGPVPSVDTDRAKAPWGRDEDGRPLLGPGAHWTDVPEVVDQELARIQGRVDQAQSGHWYVASDTEAWRPAGTVRTNVDGYQRTVGRVTNMGSADLDLVLHAHDDLSWCLEMLAKFRARVAELEHTIQGMVEGLNGHDCPPPDETPMQAVTRFAVRLMEADRLAVELEALELGDLDGRVSATCSEPSHPTWLRSASDTRGCPWCRVAELETGIAWRDAERDRWSGVHYLIEKAIDKGWSTLDTLDVEAELGPEVAPVLAESVAEPSCPCPPADQPGPHQVGCPQVALPLPGLREVPPAPERPVNELTAAFTPMPVLREVLDGEHWAAVHHDYKGPGRDFPKLGGAL